MNKSAASVQRVRSAIADLLGLDGEGEAFDGTGVGIVVTTSAHILEREDMPGSAGVIWRESLGLRHHAGSGVWLRQLREMRLSRDASLQRLGDVANAKIWHLPTDSASGKRRWAMLAPASSPATTLDQAPWRLSFLSMDGAIHLRDFEDEATALSFLAERGAMQRDDQALERLMVEARFQRALAVSEFARQVKAGDLSLWAAQEKIGVALRCEKALLALARRNRQAMFDPSGEGTIYLFADNIQPGQEGAVLMHECVHKHAQTTLGQAAWRRHVDTLKAWTHRPIESLERKIHDIALQRAQSAAGGEADLLDEELFAYAVETAVAMGIRPRLGAQRDSAQKWLTDVALTIEKALVTVFSASAPTLDAQQLVDLAYALAQLESPHAQEIRQRLGTARAELAQRLATLVAPVQRGRPTKGLSSSAICDKGGQPLTLYHFTLHSGDLDPQKTTDHGLHFGTLEQALMRRAGKKGHVVAAQLDALKVRRSTDTGSSWRSKIQSAKKAGFDAIVYLNRFEGLSNESVEALAKIDVDSLSDQEFKRLAPEARDSYVVFYADQVHRMGLNEVVGPILHSTSPEESQQDASNRRWRENFELVVTADSLASLKLSQIQSAMGYISHQIARLGPGRAWEGDQAARARIDSLNRELDLLRFEVRMRERSGIDMQQKLVVNGVARSRVNSAGQRIHPSDEGIANFWRWFGNSVTVDALGRPLVLYHGTASDFTSFDLSLGGLNHDTSDSKGVAWLTTSPYRAAAAAKDAAIVRADAPVNDGAQILPFYARVEQPHKLRSAANRSPGQLASSMNVARLKNRDGLIVAKGEMGGMDVAIFDPRQVKSALGNDGLFDRDSADFIGVAHTTTDDMRPAEVPHEQSQLR